MVSLAAAVAEDGPDIQIPQPVDDTQSNPLAALARAMRGRWTAVIAGKCVLAPAFAATGFLMGTELYQSQAILRVYPQESNILYTTGDPSVLKTFDSFVKAETTYVASHTVMTRAANQLSEANSAEKEISPSDLAGSVEVKRVDSLIVLKTLSADPMFASEKLEALIAAYLSLKSEAEDARSAVRLSELRIREDQLKTRLANLRMQQLEVGGEFGLNALAKAHIEKIAQIDGLAARKSEVAATLAALETSTEPSSADTSDQEIMRATLLDRAMADLNFERAKLMSDLAGLRAEYEDFSNLRFQRKEKSKLDEIAVIEQAMANRREQIRVLGQTGALTDATDSGNDTTTAEIRSLLAKISDQLDVARKEARDLNRRRVELDSIKNEIDEAEDLLEETRRALEVIRLETGRALPGYAVVMSPPSQPIEPAEDSSKMLAAMGLTGGAGLVLALTLLAAFRERRLRFAETLVPVEDRLPVQQVSDASEDDPHAADILRNTLQLHSLRKPRLVGDAPVIAVTRAVSGDTTAFAHALAESFARTRMKTLFIDADIAAPNRDPSRTGWRELLLGSSGKLVRSDATSRLWELSSGSDPQLEDHAVSTVMVRAALRSAMTTFDVVIVSTGSLQDRLSAQLILSNADVGVLVLNPSDRRESVLAHIDSLDDLPKHGSVAVLRNALSGDPWRAVRT